MYSIFILLILFIPLTLYMLIKKRHQFWRKQKVPYLKPKHLILGNTADVFLNNVPLFKYHQKVYNELAPYTYGGYFNFLTPVLVIRDPELIKNVLSKDFSSFMNRGDSFTDENEPLSLHIFNLSGELWKFIRKKITPTFSSGKMKMMFERMKKCSEELTNVVDEVKENEDFELRDLMARFTTDVIGSCALGVECNSLKNPDSVFRQMGKKIFATNFRSRFIGFFSSFLPNLRRTLGIKFFDKDLSQFFESLVTNTLKAREESNIYRNDFISILMDLKREARNSKTDRDNEHKFELTEKLIIGQCFVFFAAGFETSSGTSSFALYELAKNSEIQKKLYDEIIAVLKKFNNEVVYDSLQEMTYLDQVVDETLRMYPILPFLVRRCNERYKLDENFIIEQGTRVIIPVLGLHMDPQYYENPLKFNPENFSKEARNQRHHFTYLPFGEGPRICIGMRFGLTQVKLSLIMLVKNYEISLSPRMESQLKFSKSNFLASAEGGIWLRFKKRNQK